VKKQRLLVVIGEWRAMDKICQGNISMGIKEVDQLCNTLDLQSCGILNLSYSCVIDQDMPSVNLWKQINIIREKLELALSLLRKDDAYILESEILTQKIDTIAEQANWLALDAAIRSAQNGWLDAGLQSYNDEMIFLAERAEAVVAEAVTQFQETHYLRVHQTWIETPVPNNFLSAFV
jgi:hypothetical protein